MWRQSGLTARNTVCIDFCTGNDACVLTTIYSVFEKKHISLTGGTGADGKVSVNGKIYEDAAVYALVKNLGGKIKVYKEKHLCSNGRLPVCCFKDGQEQIHHRGIKWKAGKAGIHRHFEYI